MGIRKGVVKEEHRLSQIYCVQIEERNILTAAAAGVLYVHASDGRNHFQAYDTRRRQNV